MKSLGKSVLLVLSVGLVGAPAWADIPPPDACVTEGAKCSNAGPDADQSGTCESTTCTRGSPSGEITEYECLLCIAGTPSSGEAKKDDDGCNLGPVRTEHGIAGLLLLVGLAALRIGRRR